MNPVIIIPTLNEVDNIELLIKRIIKLETQYHIIIVDGGSNDGTVETVRKLSAWHSNVELVFQKEQSGFGMGLSTGFEAALEGGYDPIITMDGDLSHDPAYLNQFLTKSSDYGLVIASRYVNGVRVEGWQFRKLILSKFANMYISYVLVKPVWDFTSGFRCYSRKFIQSIDLNALRPEAYIAQIQLLYLAFLEQAGVKEVPFVFKDNQRGYSKVSEDSWRKTFFYVLKYRAPFLEILRHLTYLKKDYKRFMAEYEQLLNPPILKNGGKFEVKEKYDLSIGLMAYNEEKLIGKCIEALQNQKLNTSKIKEIIVISSGSTDRTDEIVQEYAEEDSRIRLIVQSRRLGKASAINEFLKVATGDIAVLESADTIAYPETIESLVEPFSSRTVGMTGAHPIPVNDKKSFVGFCVHKLWKLHHYMALDTPKCGELVAFRNTIQSIPDYKAVDEAAIEAIMVDLNFNLAYAPDALVSNKGPESLKDFIKQRRRIASGHRHLLSTMGHEVATHSSSKILKYILKSQKWNPRDIVYMVLLITIEIYSRVFGVLDFYIRDKNPFLFDISKSKRHTQNYCN